MNSRITKVVGFDVEIEVSTSGIERGLWKKKKISEANQHRAMLDNIYTDWP
jgi:hypothetical protein